MTIIMNKSLGTLLLVLHVSTIHKDEGAAGHVEEMADHERGPRSNGVCPQGGRC